MQCICTHAQTKQAFLSTFPAPHRYASLYHTYLQAHVRRVGGPENLAGFARRATADAKSASKRKGAARAAREGPSEAGVGVTALNPSFSVDSSDALSRSRPVGAGAWVNPRNNYDGGGVPAVHPSGQSGAHDFDAMQHGLAAGGVSRQDTVQRDLSYEIGQVRVTLRLI